jgi:hypothetical protein
MVRRHYSCHQKCMSLVCPNGIMLARAAVERVVADSLSGDIVECGVYRGGTSAMMEAALLYSSPAAPERRMWLVDSFAGIPSFDKGTFDGKPWAGQYVASEATVLANLRWLGLLGPNVRTVKGFFQDTLPSKLRTDRIAVLRFDGDTYESTIAVFSTIYDKVVDGGYVIIDDWHVSECRRALRELGHTEAIAIRANGNDDTDFKNAYWRKGRRLDAEPCLVDGCAILQV